MPVTLETCPESARFTKQHEYLIPNEGDPLRCKVGITDYACEQLGDIVFVELPQPGMTIVQFQKLGEVESVKAVSDIYAPISGRVIRINEDLAGHSELVNEDPFGKGWMLEVELDGTEQLNKLMTPQTYAELVREERDNH